MLVLPKATSYPGGLPSHTSSCPAKCAQGTSMFEGRASPRCSVHQKCLALVCENTTLESGHVPDVSLVLTDAPGSEPVWQPRGRSLLLPISWCSPWEFPYPSWTPVPSLSLGQAGRDKPLPCSTLHHAFFHAFWLPQ